MQHRISAQHGHCCLGMRALPILYRNSSKRSNSITFPGFLDTTSAAILDAKPMVAGARAEQHRSDQAWLKEEGVQECRQ